MYGRTNTTMPAVTAPALRRRIAPRASDGDGGDGEQGRAADDDARHGERC